MKTFEVLSDSWLIIAMLFRVEIVSVDVWPKISVEIEIVSITESNTTLLQQRHFCAPFIVLHKNTGLVQCRT